MILPIHNPFRGKLRVFGYASGSGNTLWKVLELQKELEKTWEGSPFEVVGVFSDNPDSQAIATARQYGFPQVSLDIRQFYAAAGKPLKDRTVRAAYDAAVMELLKPFRPDLILLAGYVWATTAIVVDSYPVVNVHPADLSIIKNERRAYAGANGIRDSLNAGERYLASTAHIATKQVDGGPILMISPPVPVDETREFAASDERDRHYLRPVNDQSRRLAARTILEIARGQLCRDWAGRVYYQGQPVPAGVRLTGWEENQPHHRRAADRLLRPRGIAVIGASARGGLGQAIVQNIKSYGFAGNLAVVNRKGEAVLGVPGFTGVGEIPGEVDLAVLAVPSAGVLAAAEECGQRGVKVLVCVSAGFKETGAEGAAREQELLDIVNRYNMRLLGPNCMGILNTDPAVRLNANILQGAPPAGNIGFVTQSGALGAAMVDSAASLGLGFSVIASLGNQGDLNVNDLLALLAADERTGVILLYLESIPEPARFVSIVSRVSATKPVVIIKAGRTAAGAAAASSHTGSLTGNDRIAGALLSGCGAIRVTTLEEAFHLTAALSRMPRLTGNQVGVVTNAGGPGILVSDLLSAAGFTLPVLPAATRKALAARLLPEASIGNPIDLVAPAPPEHYAAVVRTMLDSGLYDALLLVGVPPATIDTGQVAAAVTGEIQGARIPVLTSFFGPTLGQGGRSTMQGAGIPSFNYPEQAAHTLALMRVPGAEAAQSGPLAGPDADLKRDLRGIMDGYPGGAYLEPAVGERLLQAYGFHPVRSAYVASPSGVEELDLSYPVVAKIDHPEVIHKSDAGGVILNIATPADLAVQVSRLLGIFPGARGVQVQEQIPAGLELVLGSAGDPELGQVVMAGLGGTWVEVLQDISFGHVPVSREMAGRMLRELKCYPLLQGYRGDPGVDIEALVGSIGQLSQLLLDFPEIGEMDLNPVIFDRRSGRFVIVDFRIRLKE